jgi:hypothetical protein
MFDCIKGRFSDALSGPRLTNNKGLFEQLPTQLKEIRDAAPTTTKKKRSAPKASSSSTDKAARTNPIVRKTLQDDINGPDVASISRARTFPTPAPAHSSPRASLDGARYQMNSASNPNLRNSFQELMTPSDMSSVGTPDSSGSTYTQAQQFSINSSMPDLSAMMFPSEDPFAYPPNHPIMNYEDGKQDPMGDYSRSNPTIYVSNGNPNPGAYDDLEGQIFGPLPPYLTQGPQNFDFQGQMDMGQGMMENMGPAMNYNTGLAPDGNMNFVLSGESGVWNNMMNMNDQRYRQQ